MSAEARCPHGYALGEHCPSTICGDGSGTYIVTANDLLKPRTKLRSIKIELTEEEASYLAMHAVYEAGRQLDPRNYATSEMHPQGGQKLSPEWHTRDERARRWNEIADALHPGPIWPGGSR